MARDNDRSKVYAAEQAVRTLWERPGIVDIHGVRLAVPEERKFGAVADVQRYVDSVLAHIGCESPVRVRVRKGNLAATYCLGVIAIPEDTWALREIVVLHEIAHHLSGGDGHGANFRAAYTDLVERVLGPEARFFIQTALWDQGLTA